MAYNQPYNPALGQPMYQPYNPPTTQPYPYQDRMAGLQQYNQNLQAQFPSMQQPVQSAPQMQTVGLNGKFIQVVENITANDVPMSGEIALFPKQDMTEIYAKAWQSDGTIKTVVYKPVEPVLDSQTNISTPNGEKLKFDLSDDATEAFMKRFDDITERLEKMEKSFGKPSSGRGKKEVESDE